MPDLGELWHSYRLYLGVAALLIALLYRIYLWKPSSGVQKSNVLLHTEQSEATSKTALRPARAVGPRRIIGQKNQSRSKRSGSPELQAFTRIQPLIFFSTLSGTTEQYAKDLQQLFLKSPALQDDNFVKPELLDLSDIELDEYFTSIPQKDGIRYLYLVLLPSYDIDTNLSNFIDHLRDVHYDFRVDTGSLSGILGFSVFGLGDRTGWPSEADGFCFQAKEVDKWLAKLTARRRAYPIGMADARVDGNQRLREWQDGIATVMNDLASGGSLGEGVPGSGDPVESDEEDAEVDGDAETSRAGTSAITDVEALAGNMTTHDSPDPSSQPMPIDFTTYRKKSSQPQTAPTAPKEMVPKTSPTYAALTKQGYTIVGSHSGVKICRWTKSALRGRGSCYKFSFYGIKSHLCMETTPSLSCSNKCVFCWRHGTNPVGTSWRWTVDPPDLIFNGVKEGHYKKIKMMRGVPGVRAERFEEAMRIRHCALSLVGEPIFYPHINEFLGMLHAERISSFLVCNAQHPDQLATLHKVTQLYVSIDASNRDSLRKIDRPLHRDFWERFQRCLDILKKKRLVQRTVYRLTLVKGFNVEDEAEGYAQLVEQGLPCFVEVKGVTYCGTSSSAGVGLTMQNVPFYEEVCEFVKALEAALKRRGLAYGIAAEHAHSCCILLASDRFCVDGRWHTKIDYDRFFELLESGRDFRPEDYMAPTPEWALWGNGGFDPADTKVDRKGRKKE